MGFGIKKKIRNNIFGVKRGVHRASKFGSKAITVGEVIFPEVAAELELTKMVLNKVTSLTKEKKVKSAAHKVSSGGVRKNFDHNTDLKDINTKKSFGDKNTNIDGF